MIRVVLIISIVIAVAGNDNNSARRRYELEECDKLIPHFIDQISQNEQEEGECDETGDFPVPKDCTTFFRCVRGRGRILSFKEYCALGYTFDGIGCISNSNSTDCPQYNCTSASSKSLDVSETEVTKVKHDDDPIESISESQKFTEIKNQNPALQKQSKVILEQENIKESSQNSVHHDLEFNTFSAAQLNDDEPKENHGSLIQLNFFVIISATCLFANNFI